MSEPIEEEKEMSVWTHVTGAIRVDGLPQFGASIADVERILGKTCHWRSPIEDWKACTVPCGSEGSLQYRIYEYDKGFRWVMVPVWGDLRDYDDHLTITKWFQRVCKELRSVRQAVITIDVNSESVYTVTFEPENGRIEEKSA